MPSRKFPNYGLNGEPETRIEREFEALYENKAPAQMDKYFTVPNLTTIAAGKQILVKDGVTWYTYIKIEDVWYRQAWTDV